MKTTVLLELGCNRINYILNRIKNDGTPISLGLPQPTTARAIGYLHGLGSLCEVTGKGRKDI